MEKDIDFHIRVVGSGIYYISEVCTRGGSPQIYRLDNGEDLHMSERDRQIGIALLKHSLKQLEEMGEQN